MSADVRLWPDCHRWGGASLLLRVRAVLRQQVRDARHRYHHPGGCHHGHLFVRLLRCLQAERLPPQHG